MFPYDVPLRIEQEVFRIGAKCGKNRVVRGGYHFPDGRRFSLELSPLEAPYLLKSGVRVSGPRLRMCSVLLWWRFMPWLCDS